MTKLSFGTEVTLEGVPEALQSLSQTVLLSLMLHDNAEDRMVALQGRSLGLVGLSDALAAGLQRQTPALIADWGLTPTIEGLIVQQLPLQEAAQTLLTFPDLNPLDQSIALALYCWLCTPQQFSISVGRSHQLARLLPHRQDILRWVPALTGLLVGTTVGSNALTGQDGAIAPMMHTATHLFCLWAGMNEAHMNLAAVTEAIVSQAGRLKPRTSEHLTLDSPYD